MTWQLLHGDCREVLASMPGASVDSIVTDPPYELGFMGKRWDASGVAYDAALWTEALRVLKPGGHLLAFGGTRTYHRMACAIEDAGFEIRDSIHWIYGSGFPKSMDVSKAIDKAAGVERTVQVGTSRGVVVADNQGFGGIARGGVGITQTGVDLPVMAPATPEAERWNGWGTALKPAHEPIVVARKPLLGTVAANVLAHGTGALNIDGCRIAAGDGDGPLRWETPRGGIWQTDSTATATATNDDRGRWPANVVLDGVASAELDRQSGADDHGGASRFFFRADHGDDDLTSFRYVAKPDKAERNVGGSNSHPTVKPLDLMRWLVRLVTPPGGTVLEPFAGSGTTMAAALLEGFDVIGVELTADYLPIIEGRCEWAEREARFGPVQGPTKVRKDADAPTLFDEEAS